VGNGEAEERCKMRNTFLQKKKKKKKEKEKQEKQINKLKGKTKSSS